MGRFYRKPGTFALLTNKACVELDLTKNGTMFLTMKNVIVKDGELDVQYDNNIYLSLDGTAIVGFKALIKMVMKDKGEHSMTVERFRKKNVKTKITLSPKTFQMSLTEYKDNSDDVINTRSYTLNTAEDLSYDENIYIDDKPTSLWLETLYDTVDKLQIIGTSYQIKESMKYKTEHTKDKDKDKGNYMHEGTGETINNDVPF